MVQLPYLSASGVDNIYLDGAEWSEWSDCSVTCGLGFRSRFRFCHIGECVPVDRQDCHLQNCPTEKIEQAPSNNESINCDKFVYQTYDGFIITKDECFAILKLGIGYSMISLERGLIF